MGHTKFLLQRLACVPWLLAAGLALGWVGEAAAQTLTARFESMPESHDGSEFTFEVHFSEEVEMSFVNMRDDVLDVTGGTVTRARRLTAGQQHRLGDCHRAGFGGRCIHLSAADSRLRGGKRSMHGRQPGLIERAGGACVRSSGNGEFHRGNGGFR